MSVQTWQQHVAYDYAKLLSAGVAAGVATVGPLLASALSSSSKTAPTLFACPLLNSSYCEGLQGGGSYGIVVFNPQASARQVTLLLPLYGSNITAAKVVGSNGTTLTAGLIMNTLPGMGAGVVTMLTPSSVTLRCPRLPCPLNCWCWRWCHTLCASFVVVPALSSSLQASMTLLISVQQSL